MKKHLSQIIKYRQKQTNKRLFEELTVNKYVKYLIHPGEPKPYRIIFIRAIREKKEEVRDYLKDNLPPHSSLRVVPDVLHIDLIVSGPLSDNWIAQHSKAIEKSCESILPGEIKPLQRYRWREPIARLPKIKPISNDCDAAKLKEFLDKYAKESELRIVFNYNQLPVLSCFAIIQLDKGNAEEFCDHIFRHNWELTEPVRDIYETVKPITNDSYQATATSLRPPDVNGDVYVLCEFDYFKEENGSLYPQDAMFDAMNWLEKMRKDNFIRNISIIPCAVFHEGHDFYNKYQAFEDELEGAKYLFNLKVCSETGMSIPDAKIPVPLNTFCFCGKAREGKSFVAYALASSIYNSKDIEAADVVYVNYKGYKSRADSGTGPVTTDEKGKEITGPYDFSEVVRIVTGQELVFVKPEELDLALSRDKKGIYYTEANLQTGSKEILDKVSKNARRSVLVLFDELLGEEDELDKNVAPLVEKLNVYKEYKIFVGVIAQQLEQFYKHDKARVIIEDASLIHVGPLHNTDTEYFTQLLSRTTSKTQPEEEIKVSEAVRPQFKQHSIFHLVGLDDKGGKIIPYAFQAANIQFNLTRARPILRWENFN